MAEKHARAERQDGDVVDLFVACPVCGARLPVARKTLGTEIVCTACGDPFTPDEATTGDHTGLNPAKPRYQGGVDPRRVEPV